MSDRLNLKDVFINGARLFKEKDYPAAYKNFQYVQKNNEEYSLEVSWHIAKCLQALDSNTEAAEEYRKCIRF